MAQQVQPQQSRTVSQVLLLVLGALVIVATYVYLVLARPAEAGEGAGAGPGSLIALGGYLIGSALIISGAMRNLTTMTLALIPVGIAINIVVGQVNTVLGGPLYLDSIGTVAVGVLAGPAAGAATGALSNVIWGLTINPPLMPFAVTAAEIGLLAGLFARLGAFRRPWWPPLVGLLVGVVSAIISAPISAFVFGAVDVSAGRSAITAAFLAYGASLLGASTLQGFLSDPADKMVTFFVVYLILVALPSRFRYRFPFVQRHRVFGKRKARATPTTEERSEAQ
ncbi:MAG: histidine kinase [Streptosporangiales bacterium]|nr:histidine kinase [Streptosporangiales bacterium]